MKTALLAALVLLAPLASAAYASDVAQPARPSPVQIVAALGLAQGVEELPLPAIAAGTLREEILAFYVLAGAIPTPAGIAELDARLAALPADAHAPLAGILAAQNAAARLRAAAFAGLTAEDAAALTSLDDEAAIAAALAKVDLATMNLAGRLATAGVAAQIDALRLVTPSASFLDPLEVIELAPVTDDVHDVDRTLLVDLGGNDVWSNNAGATKPDFIIDGIPGCISTGALDCTVLGGQRNSDVTNDLFGRRCQVYGDRATFEAARAPDVADAFVDGQLAQPSIPAARDFATNGAPGFANGVVTAAAVDDGCLPQDANDVPSWTSTFFERGTLRQGDEHSVAIGLDLAGDDVFAPPREFNDINDGDNAAGCDTRSMGDAGKLWSRNLTAGGAFAGVGVLWDASGSDFYGGRSIAQGSGHVAGVGVLVDDGPGDNEYSSVRLSQGVGFFAGVGLLYSGGDGNDRYALENDVPFFNEFEHFIGCDVSTRDGQGRGNFNGAGALVDLGGNDEYFVQEHDDSIPGAVRDDPRTTQGAAGSRLQIVGPPADQVYAGAVGVLYDAGGDDSYTRPGRSDNMVTPAANGVFVDREDAVVPAAHDAIGSATAVVGEATSDPSGVALDVVCATPTSLQCTAVHGDPQIGVFRPCGPTEPTPSNNVWAWAVWYGVQVVDRGEVFTPDTSHPILRLWPVPPTSTGTGGVPVCEDRTTLLP